ncbi:MAG TPA: hypothetical protein PKH79_02720, partial [Prolixibacteraceae bacterium]|nr:hypothetical protein [Prolixibacteraceae bacterium]
MKRLIILLFLLTSVSVLYAQVSQGGYPRTYEQRNLKSAALIPSLSLKSIHVDELLAEDESLGTPYRYGVVEEVMLDVKSGLETQLDSSTVWRYEIVSDQAKSLKIFFQQLIIPDGATLFIYNNDYSKIAGAFTSANVNNDSTFAVADFPGGKLIVEYDEPFDAPFSGKVIIGSVSKAYRELEGLLSEEEDSAYLDVNCSSGIDWQIQKHSVCRYTFFEDQSSYLCTGALINNTHNDGTPYFLTANHCVSSSSSAGTVTAYFNY